IGPDPRNFNQRVSLGRNDLLIRTFPKYVTNLGAFVGRGLPVVGWAIVASDISQIVYKTVRDYNTIAHEKDRIW
ncbi:hypothetical protein QCN08_22705, partial [Enterobacter roggenkampii]